MDRFPGRAIEEENGERERERNGRAKSEREKEGRRKKTEMENRKWHFPDRMQFNSVVSSVLKFNSYMGRRVYPEHYVALSAQ